MQRRKLLAVAVAALGTMAVSLRRSLSHTMVVAIYDGTVNSCNVVTNIDSVSFPEVVPVHCPERTRENSTETDSGPRIGTARLERDGHRILAHIRFDRKPHLTPAYPCIWGKCDLSEGDDGVQYRTNLRVESLVFEPNGNADQRIQPL